MDKSGNVSDACREMLELWVEKKPKATWNQLIEALRMPGIELNAVADKIEEMLELPNKGSNIDINDIHYCYIIY